MKDKLFVLGLVAWLLLSIVRLVPVRSWPQTGGRIVDVQLDKQTHRDADGTQSTTTYRDLRYEYWVDDTRHEGTDVWRGFDFFSAWSLPVIGMPELDPGQEVTVYYDPKNPSSAVLSRSLSPSEVAVILGGPLILLLGRMKRRRPSENAP